MRDQDSSTVERLRPLVGRGAWDFCAMWEVSQNQRFLELKACCCGGAENGTTIQTGGQGRLPHVGFPSMVQACRDTMFPQHPRTKACDALEDLAPSIPLDPSSNTIHAQVVASGNPSWIHPAPLRASSSSLDGGIRTTRVLVPVPGGLVELFVENQVPEDQQIIEFVVSQFNCSPDAATFGAVDYHPHRGLDGGIGITGDPHTWVEPPIPSCDPPSFPWDLHADPSRLCASSLNLFQGPPASSGFFEGSVDSIHSEKASTLFEGVVAPQMVGHTSMAESTVSRELGGHDKESVKQEGEGRADSGMEGSDQGEDDEEGRAGRAGRRLSCKNLMAERKRRKKLNDRLYALRALVPKISKMDRASILGDAIEFVMDLQNQVKKLQDQLEEPTLEDDGSKQADNVDDCNDLNHENNKSHGLVQLDQLHQTGNIIPAGMELADSPKRTSSVMKPANPSKKNQNSSANEEKGNQMEPQVEVTPVGANKFFLKVFCEHKRGGFVRLMEAMTSLGLDVTNVNVTTSKPLVLNVFEVEKRDSEVVQADQVRSSLLKLAMDSEDGGWQADSAMAVGNGGPDCQAHQHHHHRGNIHHHQLDTHQHPHHLHYPHHHHLHHQP